VSISRQKTSQANSANNIIPDYREGGNDNPVGETTGKKNGEERETQTKQLLVVFLHASSHLSVPTLPYNPEKNGAFTKDLTLHNSKKI
jgi:hypothetical protein